MTDDDDDCIFQVTLEDQTAGTNGEYLFKNGGENEAVPNDCPNINDWGGGVNRLIAFSDVDTVLDLASFTNHHPVIDVAVLTDRDAGADTGRLPHLRPVPDPGFVTDQRTGGDNGRGIYVGRGHGPANACWNAETMRS